jgi:quercetin dioxygenase-like cupin family protein
MTHAAIADVAEVVTIQAGATVSKVIHRDEALDVTVFAFDRGEGLTEHTASRRAIVQVLAGRLAFTVDGEEVDAGPGSWIHMDEGAPHSLVALEPTTMLLTLVRP